MKNWKRIKIGCVFVIFASVACLAKGEADDGSQFNIEKAYSIQQNKVILPNSINNYSISQSPFLLYLNGIGERNVYIHASTHNHLYKKYSYPLQLKEEESIFKQGNGMAISVENRNEINLLVVGENSGAFSLITKDRRHTDAAFSSINFNEFRFIRTQEANRIYMILFVDQNDNEAIDENEIIFITLTIK